MKTFRNLKFRPNKADTKCINATLELSDGIIMSVTAGPGRYSTPGGFNDESYGFFDHYPDSNEFSSFEVGIMNENLPEEEQEWVIEGWQSRERINLKIEELCTEN